LALGLAAASLIVDCGQQPETQQPRRAKMSATLKLTRKAPVMEIRRGTFDILVDAQRVGSFEVHDTFEAPVEPGRHTLKIREGRYSSRELSFQVTDGQVVGFNCRGRRMMPIFLASFVRPSLALKLTRT
jgi:hypothetical protein